MKKTDRVLPYPKRLKTLIRSFQSTKDPKDFENILRLIDRLLIRIIQQIYKYRRYSYLAYRDPDEIYSTAILALRKVILKIKPDEDFSISKLSSYLNGYIAREFQSEFSKDTRYISYEAVELDASEVGEVKKDEPFSAEEIIDRIKVIDPDFPDQAILVIKMSLIEDRSLQQVANVMHVKKAYVRFWVNKGKAILKKIIEKERAQGLWHS